jgi:hypothetical protein
MTKTQTTAEHQIRSAMVEPLHLPLSPGEFIYEYEDGLRGKPRTTWTVTYGATPGWTHAETVRALKKKVKRVRMSDRQNGPEYSGISASALKERVGAASLRLLDEPDDPGSPATLMTHYQLVLSNRVKPVGFCTFTVSLSWIDQAKTLDFEIEVGNVFIDPAHRDENRSHNFCVVIAQFALNALGEFNDRLYAAGSRFAEGLRLSITADVASRSGERFLFSIEAELDRRKEEAYFDDHSPFRPDVGFFIEDIDVDPRW